MWSDMKNRDNEAAGEGDAKVLQEHKLNMLSHPAPHVDASADDHVRSALDGDLAARAPLHFCSNARFEMEDVALLLLKAKADVDIVDGPGRTPLHYAAEHGHIMILRALLDYNANISAPSRSGKVALHIAAMHGRINIATELLKRGAEIMRETAEGKSPLHFAFDRITEIREEHTRLKKATMHGIRATHDGDSDKKKEDSQHMLIKVLLDGGADLDHEDGKGNPAFTLEEREEWFKKNEDKMQLLLDNPTEDGHDSEVFKDQRTQAAMATKFISSGARATVMCECLKWLVFLSVFLFVAVYNTGRDNFNTYSFEYGLRSTFADEEWDEMGHFGFADVATVEEWYGFLKNAALPGLYGDPPQYDDGDGAHQFLSDPNITPVVILQSTFLDWTPCFSQLRPGFSFPRIALPFCDRATCCRRRCRRRPRRCAARCAGARGATPGSRSRSTTRATRTRSGPWASRAGPAAPRSTSAPSTTRATTGPGRKGPRPRPTGASAACAWRRRPPKPRLSACSTCGATRRPGSPRTAWAS